VTIVRRNILKIGRGGECNSCGDKVTAELLH
jgi:hypothetical protein